jgi:hypothetical protein
LTRCGGRRRVVQFPEMFYWYGLRALRHPAWRPPQRVNEVHKKHNTVFLWILVLTRIIDLSIRVNRCLQIRIQ